jgi:two-component system, LytTR family, response regulator LytT
MPAPPPNETDVPEKASLRAVVVDDEQLARAELCYLLEQLGGIEILAQAGNGIEALRVIEEYQPDLVMLDVQMPGLTGFEVARRVMHAGIDSQVVFVTAFDQYAIDAFEVNAVDYLLKPVYAGRLDQAVQRARRRLSSDRVPENPTPDLNDQLERSVKMMAGRPVHREQIAVKVGERFMLVQAEEIIYASLADESINIVTGQVSGTSNYRTLDDLQARLNPDVFWRVHRSHLVNINKIKEIVPWFSRNYILRMRDGKATEIPVSRTQTKRLREYLKL